MKHRARNLVSGWLAASLVCAAAGCDGPAFLAKAISGPPKVKAKYTLPDQPTLILIDDPEFMLGGPALPNVVANNVAYHFRQQKKPVLEAPMISQQALDTYAAEKGEAFAQTPIDRVGRDLGAATVIHATIKNVDRNFDVTVYRPKVTVEVKVIDAAEGKRLWPELGKLVDSSQPTSGYILITEVPFKDTGDTNPGTRRVLDRELAEQVGLDISRLFYDWKPPEAGSKLP